MAEELAAQVETLRLQLQQQQSILESMNRTPDFNIISATFRGAKSEMIEDYIAHVNDCFQLLGIEHSDRLKISAFQRGLRGPALAVFREEDELTNRFGGNYSRMVDFMSLKFIDPHRNMMKRAELKGLKMGRGKEAYNDYVNKFQEVARFCKMGNVEKMNCFVDGLEPGVARHVMLACASSFEQAESLASVWVTTNSCFTSASDNNSSRRYNPPNPPSENNSGRRYHPPNPPSFPPARRASDYMQLNKLQANGPRQLLCFICDSPEHVKANCPLREKVAQLRAQFNAVEGRENGPAGNDNRQ
jgi:hypothetical protein